MNITLNSKVFGKVLANVYKAITKKTVNPILQMFYLEAKGDSLKVVGSNGVITIVESMSIVNNDGDGKAVVNENLMTYIKQLPDCDVTLSTNDNSCIVSFKSGDSQLPCYPAEDYPTIQSNTEGLAAIVVSGKELLQGLNHTIQFCSNDELRPVMSGIMIDIREDQTNMVSTDTHILSIYPISLKTPSASPQSIIIPRSAMEIVKGYLGGEDVSIYSDGQTCIFQLGSSMVISRVIIGKFPDYTRVIPQDNPNRLSASKSDFLDVFNRVSTCCNKAIGLMKLSLGFMECTVEGRDLGSGTSAKEQPEGFKFDGSDTVIGFKSENLIRTVGVVNCDDVEILISAPNRAALIVAKNPEDDACKIVLMPLVVSE